MKTAIYLVLLFCLTAFPSLAQQTEAQRVALENQQREQALLQGRIEQMRRTQTVPRSLPPGSIVVPVRKNSPEEEENKRRALEEINQRLSAPAGYYSTYADFLKGKNTGIARIFPDQECDKGKVVSVQDLERCGNLPQIKGGGSLYSFRFNEIPAHLSLDLIFYYVSKSDIHFVDDKLLVGNSETQDIISNIGQTNITTIDNNFDALKFLKDFKPGKTNSKFAAQRQELEEGIESNGYLYSSSAAIKLKSSYILRSIAYYPASKYSVYKSFWHTDILVAFQIVGQEKDGSIIILWKKLKERDAPKLRI